MRFLSVPKLELVIFACSEVVTVVQTCLFCIFWYKFVKKSVRTQNHLHIRTPDTSTPLHMYTT